MITFTVSGIVAQDARLVRVKDRDYLSVNINASRSKEDAVWVTIMYGKPGIEAVHRYLVKGARIVATGTRYIDKIYAGKNGNAIDRTLWASDIDITHFVDGDQAPAAPAPAASPAPATANQNDDDLPF